ncbi:adenylate/guanylate cyclase domain-containing protein [Sorangium sp. So ce1036]|uniref:adenylate/guanylate cyclase domain-containing protein n=1 Tax=Sorangium sp. So ce1036 TaxID=3133328 RepID=UPI003F02DC3C
MSIEKSPEIVRILHAQEMRGERIVNHIRFAFALLSVYTFAHVWTVNTPAANTIFAVQIGGYLVYSLLLYAFFRLRPGAYVGWLKYVSIFVDLALLTLTALATARNHSGIIEYFTSYLSTVYVLWNLMSGFRYSLAACLYSAGLSALFNSVVLAVTVYTGAVPISPVSVYGQNAINLADQCQQVLFIALPGVVAGIIARMSRNLILRAEVESLARARLEREKQELGRYLSKDLVDFVLSDPRRLKLGGTRRHVSVMFTDIRNFTPLAESVEPEVVVSFLNEYFTEMVDIVFRYGGTLDKYIGDGLMAVFGAPLSVEDAPKRAVMAAIEMVQALERFNQRQHLGCGEIRMGVGIATGTVISGNIGSLQRMEYTCIGDTVNTASRLEQANKELGSKIIICQATYAAVNDAIPAQATGAVSIRGKNRQVHPYIVDHADVSPARLSELREQLLQAPRRMESMPPRPDAPRVPVVWSGTDRGEAQ